MSLRDELTPRGLAFRDDLVAILANCTCTPAGFSPASYGGPQEDCPRHGRPVHQVDALMPSIIAELAKVRDEALDQAVEAVRIQAWVVSRAGEATYDALNLAADEVRSLKSGGAA
jgi:hypothetical protein